MESDERAVRALHAAWMEALNAGKLDRLLGMVTEDVVLFNPGGVPLDREGFRARFSSATREFRIRCTSELREVVVAGDVAYTVCKDELAVTPCAAAADGAEPATSALAGYRITIYRKQADGSWRLARDAHTMAPVEG
jgi:uncharacterized protein (TIGR02246 family)